MPCIHLRFSEHKALDLWFWNSSKLSPKDGCNTGLRPHRILDTSVLVRLRPAQEDLRSYLIARGRKRFEVYVCTMAERDYALEMWRLLDLDSNFNNRKRVTKSYCVCEIWFEEITF
ncbi:putative protein-serine/threonine phosphatase [Helianthus annuus]|nr:putative protein-serine/threonine phosphatase [Helianthus annuus]